MDSEETPDPLLEEAMDWLLRLQDAPRDREIARGFQQWVSRSPAHAEAWRRARRSWTLLGETPPAYEHLWKEEASPSRGRAAARGRPRSRARAAGLAAAALAAAILVFVAPGIMTRLEADYVTGTGESRVVELDDGTRVTLAADTAIAAEIGETSRRLRLLDGEAYFDVAHDASRPFIVSARNVEVTALGTAFDVRLSSADTAVELAEGAVRVAYAAGAARTETTLAPERMVVVQRDDGAMTESAIALQDIAVWRDGRIFVNNATIGAVVERLQRYHPAWLTIPDGELAARRVTGVYDLGDPDRALAALVRPFGGDVVEISPFLRVLLRI